MTEDHLDFWNYPDWGPEGSNNLRDPGRVAFWEKPCREPALAPQPPQAIPYKPDLGPLGKWPSQVTYYMGWRVLSCVYSYADDLYVLRLEGCGMTDYAEVGVPVPQMLKALRYLPAPF